MADWLDQIPQLPQRQDSLADQLHDLHIVATRLGMYDAADWLARMTRWLPKKRRETVGGYSSSGRPASDLRPPPRGPGAGVPDVAGRDL